MNDNIKSDEREGCLVVLILLLLTPFTALYQGWALWMLWNWFAVPLVPSISWHVAVGLMLLIGFLKMHPAQGDQKKNDLLKRFITVQLSVIFAVGISWAFHAIGFGFHQ